MKHRLKERLRLARPLLIPVILYVGMVTFSLHWLRAHPESLGRIPVACLPLAPGLFIALGTVRTIRKLDELEQKILLQGVAVSFTLTLLLVLSMGLLGLAGVPQLNGIYIGLFMIVVWLLGKLWATWRYR